MSACPNCGKKLSCGCQKKKASNGQTVCNDCKAQYEQQLQQQMKKFTK